MQYRKTPLQYATMKKHRKAAELIRGYIAEAEAEDRLAEAGEATGGADGEIYDGKSGRDSDIGGGGGGASLETAGTGSARRRDGRDLFNLGIG